MLRVRSLLAATLLCSAACGGDSYRWYCEQLSTVPSTWRLTPNCSDRPVLRLRADQHTAVPSCDGESCLCSVSTWDYGHLDYGNGFISHDIVEVCQATATCTFAEGTATLQLVARGAELQIWSATGTSQRICDVYTATPELP